MNIRFNNIDSVLRIRKLGADPYSSCRDTSLAADAGTERFR